MPNDSSPLAPLGIPAFRNLWLANISSNMGVTIQGVGAAWLMTSLTDGAASMVALVQTASTLPVLLFALVGGTLADNYPRRNVMLGAQLFMFAVSLALIFTAFAGEISPWMLLAFTFTTGCGTALNHPSWHASVGDVVPGPHLPAAVALNSIGYNVARSLGPAVGGAAVAFAGATAAFLINAFCYLGMLGVLVHWKPNYPERQGPRERFWLALASGFCYVATSPEVLRVLTRSFLFTSTAVIVLALLPVITASKLAGDALVYGLLLGSFGLGAVLAGLFSSRIQKQFRSELVGRMAFIGFSVATLAVGLSPSPWWTVPALSLAGASWVLGLSLFNVSVQLLAPRTVVGRALALYQISSFGGMAVGSWFWGHLAEMQGIELTFGAAAVVLVLGGFVGLIIPLPSRGAANLTPTEVA